MVDILALEPAKGRKAPKIELAKTMGGVVEDITPFMATCSVYSSIEHPFMSFNCMVSDEAGIIRRTNVNGDMSLVATMTDGADRTISGKFHINSMRTHTTNGRRALGVEFVGMTAEHINNASQKVMEWKYKHNPNTCTSIISFINEKYLKGDLQVKASSFPAVNIDIVNQTPLQAISFLLERAAGSGSNIFVYYQKFDNSGKPKYFLDEVGRLARSGPKFRFHMTEQNISDKAHIIDVAYIEGKNECKILQFHQDTAFNAHDIIQQGYASKGYVEIDFVNKVTKFEVNKEQNVSMGSPQMPQVISAAKAQAGPRPTRTIYEPFNGDETYFRPPNLQKAYFNPKASSAGFLSKRITLSTYGCFNVNPGDVVVLNYKINEANPGRAIDPEYGTNHLVIAAKHSVSTNGESYSQFELAKDGQL